MKNEIEIIEKAGKIAEKDKSKAKRA